MRRQAIKLQLNEPELALLRKYGAKHSNHTGGFQGLIKALNGCTDYNGVMDIEDALLGKAVRYAISYGTGGFQDSFLRPLLRRLLQL